MVDEKEEHYEEEGEYHFADDQVNYDVEPESPKAKSTTSGLNKETILAKFTQNRRRLLGVVSILVLIGVVYKILVPSTPTTPATEFSQTTAATQTTPPVTTVTKVKSTVTSQAVNTPAAAPTASQMPAVENKPASPAYTQQNQPPVAATPPAAPVQPSIVQTSPGIAMPPSTTMPSTAGMQPTTGTSTLVQSSPGMQPAMPSPVAIANQMNTGQVQSLDAQTKDRLSTLEQQNTAMMNLLQTEYAQKIADNETSANVVRGKMEELTKRVNRMETSLNQITQLLQGMNKSQASGMMSGVPAMYNAAARPGEPKMIYSVQAIIPGRAWLKSESGDTVTVAEGDYLKRYGRVTKIDPYDGVVSIDTGSKVVTLSYGLDGE